MKQNRISSCHYIDQIREKVYEVDPLDLKIKAIHDANVALPPHPKQLLLCLSSDLQAYLDMYYKIPNGVQCDYFHI
jgi:hypothetical protein